MYLLGLGIGRAGSPKNRAKPDFFEKPESPKARKPDFLKSPKSPRARKPDF